MPTAGLFATAIFLESSLSLAVDRPRAQNLYFNLVMFLGHDIKWIDREKNIIST